MHSILEILEQSSDSAGPDLISLADLKLALGITDDSEDETLQAMITFQSRIIAEYCDRRFGFAEALETFTFDSGELILPRQGLTLSLYPVAEIFDVANDATTMAFDFDPPSGRVWTDGGWTGKVAITYAGGYDLPEGAPARLQKAVIEAVRDSRTSSTRDPSVREVQHGDTRISYFTSQASASSTGYLSAPVIELIKPFRKVYIA